MTDHGTATRDYRRIGDHPTTEDDATTERPSGLRRIGTEGAATRPAPPKEQAPPAAKKVSKQDADEWSVPSLDELSPDEDVADDDPEAVEDEEDGVVARRERRQTRPRPAPGPRRRAQVEARPSRASRLPLIAVSTVAVVLAVLVVLLGLSWLGRNHTSDLRASALAAAKRDGVLLSSYDYRNLTGPGSDWSQVEAQSTAKFKKDFLSTSGDLGKLLTQYNAQATGTVISAAISSFSDTRAVVDLFIDQNVINTTQGGKGSTQPLRSQVTLLRQGGKWLVDDLQVPK